MRLLSDAEVRLVWHRSYASLIAAPSPVTRLEIVAVRQFCLEEMERRNPRALALWLASRPHAAEAPAIYLTADPPQKPSAG